MHRPGLHYFATSWLNPILTTGESHTTLFPSPWCPTFAKLTWEELVGLAVAHPIILLNTCRVPHSSPILAWVGPGPPDKPLININDKEAGAPHNAIFVVRGQTVGGRSGAVHFNSGIQPARSLLFHVHSDSISTTTFHIWRVAHPKSSSITWRVLLPNVTRAPKGRRNVAPGEPCEPGVYIGREPKPAPRAT
jgi:hypothetical protein